nr:hypothetical protein [Tanacetum cinerariifolium]
MSSAFVDTHNMVAILAKSDTIKQSTDITRLQALVDKKKVVISKAVIHEVLRLDDAEGMDCLPNEEIFTRLARMGYEKPSSRKFNFSKYIFVSLVRNVDSSSKFYMYPRFIQLIIQNQLGDLSTHTTKYISPALTKKVFANMKKIGKGFSRVETPLFEGMLVVREDVEADIGEEQIPDDTVIVAAQEVVTTAVIEDTALDACAALTLRAEQLEYAKKAQTLEITQLKKRVKKLERVKKVKTFKLRRLKKVGTSQRVETSDDTLMEDVSNQGRMIVELDRDEGVELTGKSQGGSVYSKISSDEEKASDRSSSRRNMIMYLKNTDGFKLDYFKEKSYDDIHPIFEAKFNTNMDFLLKSKEQIEEEESRELESINETLAQKAAKRKRLNQENKDMEEIKQHLEIVPDEDDDIYTEATPLARKVPVVDYQIILLNNKPRYKILKANGTHQLYASFITVLKNFDRDDLETLWSIVKERFSTSKPNNFSDKYLLTTLRTMFRRPDGQDNVWKSQRSVYGQAMVNS